MNEIREILLLHNKLYPEMKAQDALKLIYQNEFGPGHLIADQEAAWQYLVEEAKSCTGLKEKAVPLGNGLVRIGLNGLDKKELHELFSLFCRTALIHHGELSCLIEKIAVLKQLKKEGYFSFSNEELESLLIKYEKAGYPMISHSEEYRELYQPHYRVVLEQCKEE